MGSDCGPGNVIICFHRKFDSGTWSVAVAFSSLIIFSLMFVLIVTYSIPKCACDEAYEHLSVLPIYIQIAYAVLLLYLALTIISSLLVIYGTFKAQPKKLLLYIVMITVTEIGIFVFSVFIFIYLNKIEESLLLDNDTYWNLAKLILKDELVTNLEKIIEHFSGIARLILEVNVGEALNLDKILDAALKEWVIFVMGGFKRMMNASIIIILVGINCLFFTSILTVSSHYYRLKQGILRSYTGVPEMILSRSVLSGSTKSSAELSLHSSVTPLNHNGSGATPMHRVSRNHKSSYRETPVYRTESTRNSMRNSSRNSTRNTRRTHTEPNEAIENKPKSEEIM